MSPIHGVHLTQFARFTDTGSAEFTGKRIISSEETDNDAETTLPNASWRRLLPSLDRIAQSQKQKTSRSGKVAIVRENKNYPFYSSQ